MSSVVLAKSSSSRGEQSKSSFRDLDGHQTTKESSTSFEDSLFKGTHYYNSKRYDDAISYFNSLLEDHDKRDPQEVATIHIWLGKCYYNKRTSSIHHTYGNSAARVMSSRVGIHESVQYSLSDKRMTDFAIEHLDCAIKHNHQSSLAYFWKGKCHTYDKKMREAYESYAQGAKLGNRESRKQCIKIFAANPTLPFVNTRSIVAILNDNLIQLVQSSEPYLRMEACQNIMKCDLSPKSRKAILTSLSGYSFCCCYLPCTGDSDQRIKTAARDILVSL